MMTTSQYENLESSGELLIDFGLQPVSNRFLVADDPIEAPKFPLQLLFGSDTGIIHLRKPFPVEELKPRYDWLTCFEPEDHLDDLVKRLIQLPGVTQESVFGAYSFKDDSTLRRLNEKGYGKTWRIDPERDLGVTDRCANVETYQSVFTTVRAEKIREHHGAADVLIVRHVVEHSYDLSAFIQSIRRLIKPNGYIVWELPDCERALDVGDCTTIWEEHIYYFTQFTFKQLLQGFGFVINYYDSVPYPLENSIVAIVQEASDNTNTPNPDPNLVAQELARARRFAESVASRRVTIRHKLEAIRHKHGSIALFGAGHLSVAFLSMMGIADLINCVIDDNPHKKGMRMPLGNLEIVGSDALYSGDIRICLMSLNPQNQPKVRASHQRFIGQGGLFASIFPGSELDLEILL
ncbi:MAG: methyltransferase domain-containing protein [Bacteroidia bacterium]|nr:methyltransferase domain-containing protein [Bacteroidia bacterium]